MKKFLALALAVVMALALFAGCGSNPATTDPVSTDPVSTDPVSTDPVASAGVIKVGNSGPLTGDYAVYGVAVQYGLQLAFEEINALGGLQFEVQAQDDEADSEKAVNAFNTLMDWGMQIMAGPTTSGSAIATAGECASEGVFMLTPSASDPNVLVSGAGNAFQICFSDLNQGKASADYVKAFATNVGVIYDASNPYSAGIYENFKAQAESIGLNITTVQSFTNDNKDNLTTQVAACKEAGCDLVFLPLYTAEAARVLTCASQISYETTFFGCDGLDGILDVEGFDTALAEGVLLLTPFDASASDAKTVAFVKNYTEKFGVAPNQFAADGYDVAYAIYEACTKGNVTADMSASEICEIMRAQLTTMTFDGITGQDMTWGADGAVSKAPQAVKIQDGNYVTP